MFLTVKHQEQWEVRIAVHIKSIQPAYTANGVTWRMTVTTSDCRKHVSCYDLVALVCLEIRPSEIFYASLLQIIACTVAGKLQCDENGEKEECSGDMQLEGNKLTC